MKKGIAVNHVSFAYEKDHYVLNGVSLEIPQGVFLGITGVNGSGKSTLTYLFNGLIPHFIKGKLIGEVTIDSLSTRKRNVAYFAQKVGMVFQNPDFSLFNLSVAEELEFGLKNLKLENRKERINQALEIVGLSHFANRDPQTLSLGEKQKVNLACVLALDTDYIVLDEPTAMLDYQSSLELYKILQNLNKKSKTIIVVEHDTDFLWQFTKKVFILDKGENKAFDETRKILSDKKLLTALGLKLPDII